jgi:hypothetical protein
MSALGQKWTSNWRPLMSALPPKADLAQHDRDVRFVPKADSCTATNSRLDHLVVGAGNQRTLALQWRIDDRKALLVLLEGDVGDAERFAQLVVRHFHWAR